MIRIGINNIQLDNTEHMASLFLRLLFLEAYKLLFIYL